MTALTANGSKRVLWSIWGAAGLLIFLSWWHVLSLVNDGRVRDLVTAEQDLANLTRVSQEHANRTFRSADQVIRLIRSRYLEIGDQLDLKAMIAKGLIDADLFTQVGVIDAQGIYILSNLPIRANLDLSDRDHFKVHVAADTGELFVSKPLLGRASGKWSIQLTRRITRANGDFGGVVVVSIDPAYFTHFYGDLNLGPEGLATLYGLDGVARARKIGSKEEFGISAPSALLFGRIERGELSGAYTTRSVVDGVERLYYFRKVPQYPLVVTAGLETGELLKQNRPAQEALIWQAAVVSLLIFTLAWALTRHLQQSRKSLLLRHQVQRLEQDRADQIHAIFSMSPDGFVSFDRHGCVKYVNPAFARMTAMEDVRLDGLGEQDFSACLAQRCELNASFSGIAKLRQAVTGGQPDATELIEISHQGKRILQLRLSCIPSGTVSQILYCRDVTHETELDQMKVEFLSTAAHELRSPMASILGFSEMLQSHEHDADAQKEFLEIIHRQSKLVASLLDDLLDLTRMEEKKGKDFRFARVCLQVLISDLVKAFKTPEGCVAPELVMPIQPLWVQGDAGKLQRVLLNVLSNAYKYSPAGSAVRLQMELKEVTGQLPSVHIQITDHGIGMTPEQMARIFERFYRVDVSGKIPGAGLGMSIVKEIMTLHRGDIALVSTLGAGTCVSLSFPAIQPRPAHSLNSHD